MATKWNVKISRTDTIKSWGNIEIEADSYEEAKKKLEIMIEDGQFDSMDFQLNNDEIIDSDGYKVEQD